MNLNGHKVYLAWSVMCFQAAVDVEVSSAFVGMLKEKTRVFENSLFLFANCSTLIINGLEELVVVNIFKGWFTLAAYKHKDKNFSLFRLLFSSSLMLGLWSYAYAYDDPYVAGLTSFICFVFCLVLMLMFVFKCEPGLNGVYDTSTWSNFNEMVLVTKKRNSESILGAQVCIHWPPCITILKATGLNLAVLLNLCWSRSY